LDGGGICPSEILKPLALEEILEKTDCGWCMCAKSEHHQCLIHKITLLRDRGPALLSWDKIERVTLPLSAESMNGGDCDSSSLELEKMPKEHCQWVVKSIGGLRSNSSVYFQTT
jgi:hypothetical protein